MARFFSDENFPAAVGHHLRALGHDVLTIQESGLANRGTPDSEVLEHATSHARAVLTMNRRHFIRLHLDRPEHAGIVACTADTDVVSLAQRINRAVIREESLLRKLLRVNRGM